MQDSSNQDAKPTSEQQLGQVHVGELKRHDAPITLVEYDPAWPTLYSREAQRIKAALGPRALQVEHIGSTSIPGLIAKPIIDILLVVADSSNEASYVPDLEKSGYVLRIREPEWHQHRLLKGPDTNINLHVFTAGSEEIQRVLLLRDWLRNDQDDRELYAETKRKLAGQKWKYVQHYADAKSKVVETIILHARAGNKAGSGKAPQPSLNV